MWSIYTHLIKTKPEKTSIDLAQRVGYEAEVELEPAAAGFQPQFRFLPPFIAPSPHPFTDVFLIFLIVYIQF